QAKPIRQRVRAPIAVGNRRTHATASRTKRIAVRQSFLLYSVRTRLRALLPTVPSMSDDLTDIARRTGKRQFGIRDLFAVATALAIVLGVFMQAPRPALALAVRTAPALIFSTALFSILPLVCINLFAVAVSYIIPKSDGTSSHSVPLRWWAP